MGAANEPQIELRIAGIEVRELRREGRSLSGTVYVSAACPFFDGHFPGHPVLPGIGQLAVVLALAEQPWGKLIIAGIERIKFTWSVEPETEIRFTMTRDGERLRFRLWQSAGERDVSQGMLILRER